MIDLVKSQVENDHVQTASFTRWSPSIFSTLAHGRRHHLGSQPWPMHSMQSGEIEMSFPCQRKDRRHPCSPCSSSRRQTFHRWRRM